MSATSQITRTHRGQTLTIEYRRTNPRQKRMRLTVRHDGSILFSAPPHTTNAARDRFLDDHLDWLSAAQQKRLAALAKHPKPRYQHGAQHPLLGEKVTLHVSEGRPTHVTRHGNTLSIRLPNPTAQRIEAAYTDHCRKTAQSHFTARLTALLPRTPWVTTVPELRVRRMTRQWGNCARQGRITLNVHLIQAPPECIDLVIVHELCHLKHFHHGPAFYQLMDSTLPDWRQRDQLLNSFTLNGALPRK